METSEVMGILVGVIGIGSVLVSVTVVISIASFVGRRNTEEIKELHNGFKTVIELASEMKHLNTHVERIASNIQVMRSGQDLTEKRLTSLELNLKMLKDLQMSKSNQPQKETTC